MPPQYNATVGQVLDFLDKAATDDTFRTSLQNDPRTVMQGHGLDVPAGEIPAHRTLPDKAHCANLAATARKDYAQYAPAQPAPQPMQKMMMVVGYAMPLVATAEKEVASAG
jgi:hypothetical protein